MLFRFLILVHVCAAFPLKCPEPAQWSTRARGFCPDPSKYFCLKNDLINGYSENCTIFDFLQPGRKHVLRGGLDADICSSERYQPWPITFYTNVSTNCIFLKSTCNEEGQVVYGNGNRNTDITCRCDYTRGYDFLNKPQNLCFCEPSKEDCSCFLKTCHKATDKLSSDYECHQEDKNLTVSECEAIIYQRVNTTRIKCIMEYISMKEKSSNTVQFKIILTVICIGLIFFFCMGVLLDTLLDRFFWEVYFIYEPLSNIELREGETVTLTYELSVNKYPVSFLKDNQFIAETTNIKKRVAGRTKELEFKNVAPCNAGQYCLKVEGNTSVISHLTELRIHPMFTSKIEPQICIEGDKLHLTCAVYAENIEVKWYKEYAQLHDGKNILIHMETYQRMLTIEKTTVADSGIYYVKAEKVEMRIPVTVKDMFRRPLVDVTIMEGLDTKFEFETEEENVPVQWFYNRKEIIESTERRQISRLQGRVHTLTILQTRLEDSGKYSIRIKASYDKTVGLHVKEIPETIKNMSVYDREAFLKAANTGTKTRYNIRVMIVGKQSAGKTCLLRRLLNEEIDDVISTDGINIERRKCYIDIKTGEWYFSSSDNNPLDFSTKQREEFAICGFWDFAGQKEFYATHQTFLSANAVYILVIDLSEDFKSKTYENMIEKEFDTIGEYIDFWLDNIHCYCTDDKKTSTKEHILNPPVIIVGTGIDKIPINDRKEREQKFIKHLTDTMSEQPKRRHFRKSYFLSNKFPSDYKQEFVELRKDILRKAKNLSNWEENLPVRWEVLEKEMFRCKTETAILHNEATPKTPACENGKVVLYTEAQCLADKCSFPNVLQETSELDSFLKYEHAIGNIVFFKEVKEYIVLDPEWLIDVFRCFVSHEYNDDTIGMTEWEVLSKTGKLEDTLIDTLLQKVPCLNLTKHKHYLLDLMEEFGIIVKPKNDASRNDIYMPCMIKPMPFQDIFGRVDVETEICKKSSWLCLVFNFLPPSYFNHVLVSFVKNNQLFYDTEDSRLGLYRNVGIFQLNNYGSEILVICLSKNLIAMKVLQFNSNEDACYSNIKTKLTDLVNSIKLRYRINVIYEIRFKCHDGNLIANKGIGYDEAMDKSEYLCTDHKKMHSSKEIYRFWLKEEEVEDELKKKGRRRCNYCKNMSVYKCYDCNKVLCKDCSRNHDNEEKYISHAMQPISDTFIMNCKWQMIEQYVGDIECLPNGEIIVASLLKPQIILFSVSGKQRAALQLKSQPCQMVVVDKTTVAVFLLINDLAIVDIQQNHVQYIRNNEIPNSSLIYIENEFYISNTHGIVVIDMSGRIKRRITLSFTPCDMGYDVDSQHIYCIDRGQRQLICIDRDGTIIFTFTNPNMRNLIDLAIDNEGKVLVLCEPEVDNSKHVIKVDSNGDKSEEVITNISTSGLLPPRICYDHSTNSVVIGLDYTVYIYKKK